MTDKELRKEVEVGKWYIYKWPDRASVARYVVTDIGSPSNKEYYSVLFDNGASNTIGYGSAFNLGSEEMGYDKYLELRDAAKAMQRAVSKILLRGGLDIESWWDELLEAQGGLAKNIKLTSKERGENSKLLEPLIEASLPPIIHGGSVL